MVLECQSHPGCKCWS
ncbi:hypothetical protein MTR67_040185 [Solanum verrucosum]|uniref:Uncharacterized protein n=1 Tax=Solanum verrucosum TaxID=315347 RepID=A0AAF0UJC5_SOLVR|nr:hypothetical protein MTR67_040185 [Solanum verrucosum]